MKLVQGTIAGKQSWSRARFAMAQPDSFAHCISRSNLEEVVVALPLVPAEEGPRSKRAAILISASRHFGVEGYDATKWSTIAQEVGIGQTALYHYFESKAHCLLTIMQHQLQQSFESFNEAVQDAPDPLTAVREALVGVYAVTDDDILRLRLLHSNMTILSTPRTSAREEKERIAARQLISDFETAWTRLLDQAMDAGQVPRRDPRQLARAVLGLAVSVWSWFTPGGELSIREVGAFTTDCCLRVVGSSASPLTESTPYDER